MRQKSSRGTRAYPRKDAADWEVSGAIADIAMAPWGMGSTKTAEARLRCALKLVPDHPEGLNLLAQVCAQTSRHKEAFSLLERGIAALATRPIIDPAAVGVYGVHVNGPDFVTVQGLEFTDSSGGAQITDPDFLLGERLAD